MLLFCFLNEMLFFWDILQKKNDLSKISLNFFLIIFWY